MSTRGFVINNDILEKYTGSAEDVSIPEGVKEIWGTAFFNKNPKTITIPGSLTTIGSGAFDGNALQEIKVAEENKTFCSMDGVLYNKDKTKLICFPRGKADHYTIPAGVISIGERAFSNCVKMVEVSIPDSVIEIGSESFRDCIKLESITLPKGLTHIGDSAFFNCKSIKRLTIPESVEQIGDNAFTYCKGLADENGFVMIRGTLYLYAGNEGNVVIPERVTAIANSAFAYCGTLTSVMIPSSVTSIGTNAFSNCPNLTSITIPESVIGIGDNAFWGCSSLTSVMISEGVTHIGDGAFAYCSNLKRVSIPDTVTTVEKEVFPYRADCLIAVCDPARLPTPLRPNAVICFAEDGGSGKDPRFECHCKYIKANAAKLVNAAMEHPALLSLMCREKLIKAKDVDTYLVEAENRADTEKKALLLDYRNSLGSKTVEKARERKEKVKENYADALVGRTAARDPEKGIEGMTFVITGDLNEWESRKEAQAYLELHGAKLDSSVTKKTDYLVTNDTDSGSKKNQKAHELGVPVITEGEFNLIVKKRYADAPQIDIPGWVKAIPEHAFMNCVSLTSITIPDGIPSIEGAFYKCKSIQRIDIPQSVTQMKGAFFGCSNLTEVRIPEGVTDLTGTFSGCSALKSIVIPKGVTEIDGAFSGCSQLKEIEIPTGVTEIGGFTFEGCEKLKMVCIPDGVKRIGLYAFRNCMDLEQVRIPATVKDIDGHAFDNCPNLTIRASKKSYAAKYAEKNNIRFVAE